eukprot:21222-Heterococcus_DN1.PRE.5
MGGALSFAGTHRSRPEPDCNDGYAECVSMLLAAGADPNVTSIQGKSIYCKLMSLSLFHTRTRYMQLFTYNAYLPSLVCSVVVHNTILYTAMHAHFCWSQTGGYTPLMGAALTGSGQCCWLLLRAGARLSARTSSTDTRPRQHHHHSSSHHHSSHHSGHHSSHAGSSSGGHHSSSGHHHSHHSAAAAVSSTALITTAACSYLSLCLLRDERCSAVHWCSTDMYHSVAACTCMDQDNDGQTALDFAQSARLGASGGHEHVIRVLKDPPKLIPRSPLQIVVRLCDKSLVDEEIKCWTNGQSKDVVRTNTGMTRKPRRDFCRDGVVDRGIALRNSLSLQCRVASMSYAYVNSQYVQDRITTACTAACTSATTAVPFVSCITHTTFADATDYSLLYSTDNNNTAPRTASTIIHNLRPGQTYSFTVACVAEVGDTGLQQSPPSAMSKQIFIPRIKRAHCSCTTDCTTAAAHYTQLQDDAQWTVGGVFSKMMNATGNHHHAGATPVKDEGRAVTAVTSSRALPPRASHNNNSSSNISSSASSSTGHHQQQQQQQSLNRHDSAALLLQQQQQQQQRLSSSGSSART